MVGWAGASLGSALLGRLGSQNFQEGIRKTCSKLAARGHSSCLHWVLAQMGQAAFLSFPFLSLSLKPLVALHTFRAL